MGEMLLSDISYAV